MSPCLTSCCPCRGSPAQAPRQWQHKVRRGVPMIAAPPLSGCPLAKPATQNWRWPCEGKSITIGTTTGILINHYGVSPCCTIPPVAKARHRNDTNAPRNANESYPHPPNPPRCSGVTIVGRATAIATHTQSRRTIVPKRFATPLPPDCPPGPDIATVWACPTPSDTHTARL